MNRYDRPSWATGILIALACVVATAAGLVSLIEGRKIKRIEGPPPDELPSGGEHLQSIR